MTSVDPFRLDGKVAVVTGGGRGIGRGIALAFARAGADVAVLARRSADVEAVAAEVKKLGRRGLGLAGDVTVDSVIPAALDRVVETLGRIDIMVNNAGGNTDRKAHALPEMSLEKWDEQLGLNMRHKFWGSRQAAARMPDGGRIINIISRAAFHPSPGFGAYSAGNLGIVAMTRTMSVELAPRRITVNCIAPGVIYTDLFAESLHLTPEETQASPRWESPLGRVGTPDDIAGAALYFASPAAEWVTGQHLIVAGGR